MPCPVELLCPGALGAVRFGVERAEGRALLNVLMHPFTLHSLARGNTLKRFAPCACLSFRIFDAGYRWLVLMMWQYFISL